MDRAHIFAFYTEFVSYIVKNRSRFDIQEITDTILIYRISNVLRLEKEDIIIIFNSQYNIRCKIIGIEAKKKIVVELTDIEPNIALKPKIVALLPILKKEAFESSIYFLTQMAVDTIQLLITEKTHKFGNIDYSRLKKIMISACEQSKQFILPNLSEMLPLEIYLLSRSIDNLNQDNINIFFDKAGEKFLNIINIINSRAIDNIFALIGPEADLTEKEKNKLIQYGFNFCCLTKSILRSQDAVSVGFGALRALI